MKHLLPYKIINESFSTINMNVFLSKKINSNSLNSKREKSIREYFNNQNIKISLEKNRSGYSSLHILDKDHQVIYFQILECQDEYFYLMAISDGLSYLDDKIPFSTKFFECDQIEEVLEVFDYYIDIWNFYKNKSN